jgi:2-dehydropantoate 2-reductase
MSERVAIVGAGALGQAFGWYLHCAGAELTYVVKETYRESTEAGFTLHELRMLGGPRRHEFDDFEVCVDYDALADEDWDQVWLCVSSPAIRGDWLPELLEAVGETTLASIQPGIDDRDHLEAHYPAERIASGRVSMIAYPTALPGEELPEGDLAFFMPPGERIWWGGSQTAAREVADLLEAGGCPAGVRDDLRSYALFSSALLETLVAGLELADWSLSDFRRGSELDLAMTAADEAIDVVAAKFQASPPMGLRLGTSSLSMRLGLPVASALIPFDFEAYLEAHFTKVSDQTRDELRAFIDNGRAHDIEVEALSALLERLEAQ